MKINLHDTSKERPISFGSDMIHSIIWEHNHPGEGKTQTRRLGGLRKLPRLAGLVRTYTDNGITTAHFTMPLRWPSNCPNHSFSVRCPYGGPDTLLWAREEFTIDHSRGHQLIYRADMDDKEAEQFVKDTGLVWYPASKMQKYESRILLKITDVCVELLRDISEKDAIAEGVEKIGPNYRDYLEKTAIYTARESFFTLIHKIYGKKILMENPYVWAIKFKILTVND